MRTVLLATTALMIWGPPRLRLASRPLETSLTDPLNLDLAAFLQVCAWTLSLVVMAAALVRRGKDRPPLPYLLRRGALRFYLAFAFLALFSALYSQHPTYTIFFASRLLLALLAIALLTENVRGLEAVRQVLNVFYAVYVAQWLAIVICYYVNPNLVGSYVPRVGYRLHAAIFNDFGVSAAIAGLYFLSKVLSQKRVSRWIFFFVLYSFTLYFIYLCRTRSAAASVIVFCCILVGLQKKWWFKYAAVVILAVGLAIIVVGEVRTDIMAYLMRGQGIHQLLSLTGRRQAFDHLLDIWRESPVYGYGFAAGSRAFLMSFVYEYGMGIGAAHDALSKVLIELGVLGLALLCVAFGVGLVELGRAWRRAKEIAGARPLMQEAVALMAYAMVSSVVGGGLADLSFPFIISLAVASVVMRVRARDVARSSSQGATAMAAA